MDTSLPGSLPAPLQKVWGPGGPGGRQSAALRSPNKPIPSTAELIKRHPGDFPPTTLSFTKQRSPLWKPSLRTPREAIWKQLLIGVGLIKAVECTGLRRIQSPFLTGSRGGVASGLAGMLARVSWRGEGWGVDVPGRLLWNVHKMN